MKVLLGKKLEMTQVFREDGTVVPVTLVQAGPCMVTAVKCNEQGKTTAVLGYGSKKHIAKAQKEDWKELGSFAFVREFALEDGETLERGQTVDVSIFEPGVKIDVTGVSKGKGFQGVVRRHGFHGSPASHGHKDQLRMPGSIGAQGPQRVFKGVRMAGHMGTDQITVKNLEVVEVDATKNIIAIRGAVPGSRGGFVTLMATEGTVWQK
ncbi:MAG: 50S ribosomal protein L3 [Patescibacteria group bacterium]|nr:50S ribosomal protein L3 [Patescibacteria group bacterium]